MEPLTPTFHIREPRTSSVPQCQQVNRTPLHPRNSAPPLIPPSRIVSLRATRNLTANGCPETIREDYRLQPRVAIYRVSKPRISEPRANSSQQPTITNPYIITNFSPSPPTPHTWKPTHHICKPAITKANQSAEKTNQPTTCPSYTSDTPENQSN